MIEIIVLIQIKNIESYKDFETKAVHIMKEHGGQLLSAFEPDNSESTETHVNEVHYLRFPDLESFHNYRSDPKLLDLSALREQAISRTKIIVSGAFKYYE